MRLLSFSPSSNLSLCVSACLAYLSLSLSPCEAAAAAAPAHLFKRYSQQLSQHQQQQQHDAHADVQVLSAKAHTRSHHEVYGSPHKVQRRAKQHQQQQQRMASHQHLQSERAQAELRRMKTQAVGVQPALSSYTAAAQADAVTSLPGLVDSINFNQFSGYLSAGGGKQLHYWFVESMSSPGSDPLLWWTNGGPGCSGLIAFFEEHGPFRIQPDNSTVLLNPYAWNRLANVIFIEAPVGVGFSYSSNATDYTLSGDLHTAEENYVALQSFFQKFPQYKQGTRPLWLTGESYGGHYVPQLALQFAQRGTPVDAIYLGNPFVDWFSNEYEGALATFYGHSLIDYTTWQQVQQKCIEPFLADPYVPSNGTGFIPWQDSDCNQIDFYAETLVVPQTYTPQNGLLGLDPYGLDYPYCSPLEAIREQMYYQAEKASLLAANQSVRDTEALTQTAGVNITYFGACTDHWTTTYLNRTDVLEAIHVNYSNTIASNYRTNNTDGTLRLSNDHSWQSCSKVVGYYYNTSDYYTSQEPIYQQLFELAPSMQFIIFSGDDDSVCATTGTQWWLNNFKLMGGAADLKPVTPWTAWYDDAQPDQYGGYYQKFDKITLTTIHGAGHEIEFYQPERGFANFEKALAGTWNVDKETVG